MNEQEIANQLHAILTNGEPANVQIAQLVKLDAILWSDICSEGKEQVICPKVKDCTAQCYAGHKKPHIKDSLEDDCTAFGNCPACIPVPSAKPQEQLFTVKITRKEFLKLPIKTRRRLLAENITEMFANIPDEQREKEMHDMMD